MARLAQASISFRRLDIDEEHFRELGVQVDDVASKIAREIYGAGVEVDVVLEAGSLLVRITVIGGLLLGSYDAISKYEDFKKGVSELVKDAHEYGSAVYNEVLKLTGEQRADIVAKRDMTPGRIARLIQKLEEIQHLEKNVPNRVMQKALQQIARDVQAIERDLEPEERRLLDKQLESRGLPPLEKLPTLVEEDRIAIERKREVGQALQLPGLSAPEKRKRLRYHNRFVVEELGRPPRRLK